MAIEPVVGLLLGTLFLVVVALYMDRHRAEDGAKGKDSRKPRGNRPHRAAKRRAAAPAR